MNKTLIPYNKQIDCKTAAALMNKNKQKTKQSDKEILNNFLFIQKSENYKQAIKQVCDEKLAFKK